MNVIDIILGVLFIIICLFLIGIVLLQKGKGGGLGAALGGMGQAAFGTKTADMLTWFTIALVGAFLLLAIGTSVAYRPEPTRLDQVQVIVPGDEGMMALPAGREEYPIAEETTVRVLTRTPGVDIHYTTEQREPTEDDDAVKNRGEIVVEPGQALRLRAWRPGDWVPSDVRTIYFRPAESETQPAEQAGPPEGELPAGPGGDAGAGDLGETPAE